MIVYDLDGTLFNAPPLEEAKRLGIYHDPEACLDQIKPDRRTCDFVRLLHEPPPAWVGPHVPSHAYLTGRPEKLRHATETQLERAGLPGAELVMSPGWAGWDYYIEYKARHLRRLDANLYVGDRGADQVAAKEAGTTFLWADDFRDLARRLTPPNHNAYR